MIALAPQPAVTNQPRSIADLIKSVSASRLGTWQRCRLQFFFRYVEGIKKPATPALHIGSTVHTVLQQWNLARWRKAVLDNAALREVFLQAWTSQAGGATRGGGTGIRVPYPGLQLVRAEVPG